MAQTPMASREDRYKDNAPGPFYVDEQCIDCDACRACAPDFFRRSDVGGYSYVYRQPQTEAEHALCREALDGCPVEAIGDDGE
jgi:ferredoxin